MLCLKWFINIFFLPSSRSVDLPYLMSWPCSLCSAFISNIYIFFSKQAIHKVYVNTYVRTRTSSSLQEKKDPYVMLLSSESNLITFLTIPLCAAHDRDQCEETRSRISQWRKKEKWKWQTNCSALTNLLVNKTCICSSFLHLLILKGRSRKQVTKKKKRLVRSYRTLDFFFFFLHVTMKV